MVETAFRQAAFEYLEVQPMFPLHTLFRVVGSWIYGADPLRFLRLGTHLGHLPETMAAEPDLFARLLRDRLIDNPHRLNVVMSPDRAMQGELEARLQTRVGRIESAMSEEQVAAAAAAAAELEQLNSTPNTPETACQPAAAPGIGPAGRAAARPTPRWARSPGITLLRNDLFANGVNYLAADFDLTGLPAELWPYLPRYLEAMEKLGVDGAGYEEIARRKAAATGGVRASLSLSHHGVRAEHTLRGVRFSLKALDGPDGGSPGTARQPGVRRRSA